MEAGGAVDAKNAPTAPCKTRRRVSHSYHRPSSRGLTVNKCHPCSRFTLLPMFPVAHGFRPCGDLVATAMQQPRYQYVALVTVVDDVVLDGERSNAFAEL